MLLGFQKQAVEWLRTRPKALIALEQGLGKTVISCVDAEAPITVVCTAAMKYRWAEEFETWRPDLFSQVIVDPRTEINWDCDVHIINYDILTRFKIPKPRTLIVDEAHKVKTETAKRTMAVMAIAQRVDRVRFLSGTPMLSRPVELFPMLKMLKAVHANWFKFVKRYCAAWNTPWGSLDVSGASNLDELAKVVAPVMLRMTKKQVMPELPPKIYRIVSFDGYVTRQEEEFLDYHKRHLRLPPGPIAFQAISDIRRVHAERKLPQAIRYIRDVLESMEVKKLVVFAHHRATVEALVEALSEFNPVHIMGGTRPKDAFASVQAFQNDDKVQVFIGNLQAAGEGITLTAASHVVIVEPSWVPGEIAQAADRCHRIGTKSSVTVDLLTVQGSIDARMIKRVIEKEEVINQVIKETPMAKTETLADLMEEAGTIFKRMAAAIADGEVPKAAEADAEETPKRGRGRPRKADEEAEKPARGRRGAKDEDEEAEKPARGRRGAKDEDEAEKPARGRRGAKDEDEEAEKPARGRRGAKDEDEKPARGRRGAKDEDEKPKAPSLADVRKAASKLIAQRKRDVLNEILEDFDAADLSDLDEKDFAEFIKECEAESDDE
jgi:SWI/SNF-related matrix-associated actin-dependent regulator of chromatin subfamily A-like protein 1